jgi:hypothetical protein
VRRRSILSRDGLTSLDPDTRKFERQKALNVWIAIGTWWLVSGRRWTAPVFYLLWEYMIACGAPLPKRYLAAERARMRLTAKVHAALDPKSEMRVGTRHRVLRENPLVVLVVLEFGKLKARRNPRGPR